MSAPTVVSIFAFNNPPGYDSSSIRDYYNLVFQRDHPTVATSHRSSSPRR